jgi:hypothetical protein
MSYYDRHKAKAHLKSEKERLFQDESLEQLKAIARKRCQTIFVGAVAKIETFFGQLWDEANNLDESDMTEEQLRWFDRFLDCRERIFDQGNDQISKLLRDLDNFGVYWHRNRIDFIKKDRKDNER